MTELLQFNPFTPILLVTALLCLHLAWDAWKTRYPDARRYLSLLLLTMGIWALLDGLQAMVRPLWLIQILSGLQFPFIHAVGPLWLLFTASFVRRRLLPRRGWEWLLWVVPGLIVALNWSNDLHMLFFTEIRLEPVSWGVVGVFTSGPLMYLSAAWGYLQILAGVGVLVMAIPPAPPVQRRQIGVTLAAMVFPLVGNVLYVVWQPIPGIDFSPILFTISGALLSLNTSRLGFMQVVPLAYDLMLSSQACGVVVLNEDRGVAEINGRAREIYAPAADWLGAPASRLLEAQPELLRLLEDGGPRQVELEIEQDGIRRWYEVGTLDVQHRSGLRCGWLLLYKDIQERRDNERRLQTETAFFGLLNEITEAALAETGLPRMLQVLADRMSDLVQADACSITFWDEEQDRTIPAAASGPVRERYSSDISPAGERTLTRSVLEAGHPLVIFDTHNTPYQNPSIARMYPSRSVVVFPLLVDGARLGAVIFGSNEPRLFKDGEIQRGEAAARHIALAIGKMRLLEDASKQADQLHALNRVGSLITSGLDGRDVIRRVCESTLQVVPGDVIYLAIYDEVGGQLRMPVLYLDGKLMTPTPSAPEGGENGMVRHVLRTRESVLVSDLAAEGLVLPFTAVHIGEADIRSLIAAPVVLNDQVLGVLSVQSRRSHAYRRADQTLLETIASQAAVALENARLYGEVRRLSTIDELTGLYNYRSMLEIGGREVERARRFGRPLSALFFDVDHFREFNNRFSHAVGNQVLVSMAACARENLREVDLLFRYGGDELVALLPETGLETAVQVAERLRAAVEGLGGPGGQEGLRITVSVGAAELGEDMESLQALISPANRAEKRAKDLGRNRVEAAAVQDRLA